MSVPNFPVGIDELSCPKACYLIDSHSKLKWHVQWARQFDVVFIAQREYIPQFRAAGCKNVRWLPLACLPAVNRKYDVEKRYDIGFVGNVYSDDCYSKRALYLKRLQGQFNTFIGKKYYEEMSRLFSQSKIVFNISAINDLNNRVFEAMASGSMLLTDRAPGSGLTELFESGRHLVTYDGEEDLIEKARYYLSHPEEREAIAECGYGEVHALHTYDERVREIVGTLFPEKTALRNEGIQPDPTKRSNSRVAAARRESARQTERLAEARRRWQYYRLRSQDPGYNLPSTYQIEPSTFCNLRCRMCSQSRWDDTQLERGHMSLDNFRRIVDQIPNPHSFLLFQGLGEPFANKDYIQMLRYASRLGFGIMTATNGLLLKNQQICGEVIDSGLHMLVYSVDSFDPEIYREIRGAEVADVLSNIEMMIGHRDGMGKLFPRVQINVVGMPDTIPGLPGLVERAGRMGVDVVKIQEEREENPRFDSCMLDAGALAVIDKARAVAKQYGVALQVNPKVINPYCKSIGNLCYISWDGYLTPCCGNFTGSNPKWLNMGNILETSLAATWFGPRYRNFYRRLAMMNPPKPCLQCHVGIKIAEHAMSAAKQDPAVNVKAESHFEKAGATALDKSFVVQK